MFFQIKSFTAMSLSLSLHVIEHIFNRSKHTRYCSPNKKGKKQRLKDWKQSKLKVEVFVPLQKINALINFFSYSSLLFSVLSLKTISLTDFSSLFLRRLLYLAITKMFYILLNEKKLNHVRYLQSIHVPFKT